MLSGGAGVIAATMAELEQVGVAHLLVELPGSSEVELLRNIEWFGREVLRKSRCAVQFFPVTTVSMSGC